LRFFFVVVVVVGAAFWTNVVFVLIVVILQLVRECGWITRLLSLQRNSDDFSVFIIFVLKRALKIKKTLTIFDIG
jgi:hypothetical protein